ncbi:MAG: hypothetical protein PWP12_636 [Bacillota bacterium]|jgi:sporulation protein YabP|nr:hypothetical protein [Bacillota bacterium]MDK2881876.1 hypothetical protein [Bacillota bacterium]MDK2960452.1 hypothetical protein [Bacillota bacterium]
MDLRNEEHRIILLNREKLEVSGVRGVASFNDRGIVLETNMGILRCKGQGLHIKQLSLEQGRVEVEGEIAGLEYGETEEERKSKGILARLLK